MDYYAYVLSIDADFAESLSYALNQLRLLLRCSTFPHLNYDYWQIITSSTNLRSTDLKSIRE